METEKIQTPVAFCLTELETSKKTLENIAEQLPKLHAVYEKKKGTPKEQESLAEFAKAAMRLWDEVAATVPCLLEYGDSSLAKTAQRFYEKLKKTDYLQRNTPFQ